MSETRIVYVDDSGTDGKSRIAAAAFCVSTEARWGEFEQKWQKIANHAGFRLDQFHITEFAACRRDNLCQQCRNGKTTSADHPWGNWPRDKRENVLNRMAKALVKSVECGWGLAYTKEDYDAHVRTSPARAVTNKPIGDEYLTFSVQQCGGKFAQWRAACGRNDPLKFVFDSASKKERSEIEKVFFGAAADRSKNENGIEQWFEPEVNSVSYENRRTTRPLLAADMLAWTIATIRAREITMRGRFVEVFQLAKIFVGTEHIKIGYTSKETLAQWEKDTLNKALKSDDKDTPPIG
jgi:hypothetical protein